MNKKFEKREYIFERAGWVCMALVVLSAALGLMGKGPLSRQVGANGAFQIRYDHFLHYGDPTVLLIHIAAVANQDTPVDLVFPNQYLQNFRIVQITPEPEYLANGDQTVFHFKLRDPRQSLSIQFDIEPQIIGQVDGMIRFGADGVFDFKQFIYP